MTEAINSSRSNEMPDPESAVDWAVWLAKKGMYVFPVDHPDAPVCKGLHPKGVCSGERGKHPLVKWSEASTRDIPTIYDWASGSAVNFAIDCGKSNLLVVDADTPEALLDFIGSETGKKFGATIPDTLMVETGKGGHVYFQQPGDAVMTNSPGLFKGHSIDVRGQGGYVIAPGSKHASGKRYAVVGDDTVIRPVPDWVKKTVKGAKTKKERTTSTTVDADEFLMGEDRRSFSWATAFEDAANVGNGEQRDFLISAIGSMCARGIPEEIAIRTLLDLAAKLPVFKADQPWEDSYVEAMYEEMAGKWQEEHKLGIFEPVDPPAPAEETSGEVSAPPKNAWKTPEIRELLGNPEVKEQAKRLWNIEQARTVVDALRASERVQEIPAVFSLTDLLAVPLEGTLWRLGGLLPKGGRAVLAAARKAGKTTLIGNLVKALADVPEDRDPFVPVDDFLMGTVNGFLRRSIVTDVPGKIVVVDNEMSPAMLQKWYQDMGIEHTDRVEVWPLRGKASTFNIIDKSVRRQWAERLKGASFLILDCLAPFLAALGLEETNGDVGKFLEAVDALMAEAGISDLVLVHHMGHGDERSRGASRLRDWPDVEWKLVRERDGNGVEIDNGSRFFSAYGRDVDCPESELDYNPMTRELSVKGGNRVQKKLTKDRGPVMDVIKREPGLGRNEIVATLSGELSQDRVKKALMALTQTGEVHTALGERRKTHHFDGTDHECPDQKACSKLADLTGSVGQTGSAVG